MRKRGGKILIWLVILLVVPVIYVIWENQRITVAEQEVEIDQLPDEFENFTILQISDLHEKEFGENQKNLIKAVNSIEYDAIVFTGDMLNSTESTAYEAFYSFVEGITNKENALYIPGNADPESYKLNSQGTLVKDEFIAGMEERGVKLLESVHSIEAGESALHFTEFELSLWTYTTEPRNIQGVVQPTYISLPQYEDRRNQLMKEMAVLDDLQASDVVIALNHYPVVDARIDHITSSAVLTFRAYDLILAGHYHGGQIRLPFLGVVFVPEPWYERSGLFPPRDRVKGLWEYKGTKQYVSTGLGSSGALPYLNFRVFNPPEINVLKLKASK
ncbi:metallophosphoesterase [Jeotgalibacillus soli]|uniref:Calcineurin-like phosphoesterase domain-containing protein n=1 Tax=Jeotgalibacillus soli TaxID=889306 RepID=A0A0C2RGT1_9BACL|nr:metallophosphoesterase [Jeotgalibacillus soli]KIL49380.1 hypothetical protein KP78_08480 [Jeotgalibacillus soli]